LRIANAFLGVARQRIFEIVFDAEPKSDQMLSAAVKIHHDSAEGRRSRIKNDAASLSWIDEFIGEYRCPQLGPAQIQRDGDGFRIDFESWGSDLGSEIQEDGARLIVLTSPPWSGAGLRFQTSNETGDLILDAGQEKYTFQRV
jgi:hypothetical protein